jgi:hypothetical protein
MTLLIVDQKNRKVIYMQEFSMSKVYSELIVTY